MKPVLIGVTGAFIAAVLFVASPFWAAWELREAIRTSDTRYLERKVEWDSVRQSLKASMARHANLVPEIEAASQVVKPGIWQRVKTAFGQSLIDSFVERYVTPTGLPQLLEYRKTYNSKVRLEPDQAKMLTRYERFQRFWARLKRAEFQSLSRVELEIEDKRNPQRRYVSVMELRDFEWKLTGLRITAAPLQPEPPEETAARAAAMAVPEER